MDRVSQKPPRKPPREKRHKYLKKPFSFPSSSRGLVMNQNRQSNGLPCRSHNAQDRRSWETVNFRGTDVSALHSTH
jgi:hypothetical protein